MIGGDFELYGGFWFSPAPTDCNEDRGVNLYDCDDFELCLAGPDAGTPTGCECSDVNRSGTVDVLDFAVAQTTFTGS